MEHRPNAKHWIIREQIVADPVTGLTLEFAMTSDGEPALTLYGDCLVFGNRRIVFQDDQGTVHAETKIPHPGEEEGHQGSGIDDDTTDHKIACGSYRAMPR